MKPFYESHLKNVDNWIISTVVNVHSFDVPWHYHPEIELMCINKGSGLRLVGDSIQDYSEDDVCLIGGGLPHEWRSENVDEREKIGASCNCIFLKPEMFRNELFQLTDLQPIVSLIRKSQRGIKFTGDSRKNFIDQIHNIPAETGIKQLCATLTLLSQMSVSEDYELLSSVGFSESINHTDFLRFNKIYKFLTTNYGRQIKLEEVANIAGLSPNSFCKYFKGRTKRTFVEYLNMMRISQAKRLIIQDKIKITNIAIEVGFNNFSNFVEQFKKYSNMTPSEYQRRYGLRKNKAI